MWDSPRLQDLPSTPSTSTRNCESKTGGTVLIGGIFENANNQNSAQLPILAEIPIFGWLFKQTSRKDLKQELLVFLKPKMQVQRAVAQ
ncbi:MAG: hypothetical protein EXR35_09390 [Limnohabitans sp.]|nr:hypothetical protein [Limnohabitans sp.]